MFDYRMNDIGSISEKKKKKETNLSIKTSF